MKKYIIMLLTVASIFFMTGAVAASEDIIINPADQNPIKVQIGVPLNVYPPLNVTLIDWATNGASSYNITVVHDASKFVNCSFTGPVIGTTQTVDLIGCVLNDEANYTIYASAECPQGNCTNPFRSRHLKVDAAISPIPEMITFALVGLGLVGLIGFARSRR